MTKTATEFKEHLNQQLGYIKRSADLYDRGHHDEAARIAVSLRVLLHDTGSSTSLLTHMGAKSIRLASKASDDSHILARYPNIKGFQKTDLIVISIGTCAPDLTPAARFTDIPTWWNECIIAQPPYPNVSRKNVILWVANKDGGAHVDSTVPPVYEWLKEDGAIGSLELGGKLEEIPDAPFTLLRTMASEILESPDLFALA